MTSTEINLTLVSDTSENLTPK